MIIQQGEYRLMEFVLGGQGFDGSRPLVMGILNATPDSFYAESRVSGLDRAVDRALAMVEAGADIIDIGGESSRPGAEKVREDVEMSRVMPLIETIASRVSVPLSIDTYHANVAARAVELGATVINDISAMRFDPGMADVVQNTGASVVLMHMQGNPRTMQRRPEYEDVVEEVLSFLRERVEMAVANGIPRERIVVDPGIGFGKTLDQNLAIIRDIHRFHETGCAVLVGVSRKSMLGMITGAPVEQRLWGTAAVTAYCVSRGVEIHRVHDVRAIRHVCDVMTAIRG